MMGKKDNTIDGAVPRAGLQHHAWPAPEEHLWSNWRSNTPRRVGENPKPPTEYRLCTHPRCNAVEVREVPNA